MSYTLETRDEVRTNALKLLKGDYDIEWEHITFTSEELGKITEDYYTTTPDMISLNKRNHHLVFIYDNLKSSFKNKRTDIYGLKNLVGFGHTNASLKMYMLKDGEMKKCILTFDPKKILGDSNPYPIFGEVYSVKPSTIRDLDFHYGNKLGMARIKNYVNTIVDKDGTVKQLFCNVYLNIASYLEHKATKIQKITPFKSNKDNYTYYNYIPFYEKAN